ncbi:MAG TPA: hypothetical protein VGQ28_09155, partial [Thermoanaerobaculia bacterium]|nr:hypothetical protein [Thermoanaerobaculia bacterium]
MEAHPTPQELREFAEGGLPKEQTRKVVAHFLHGCGPCRAEAAALLNLIRIRRGPRVESPERLQVYDQAFDRALEILQATRPAAAPEAAEAAAPAWLNALAGVSSGLDVPELVEALLDRAWSLRHEKPTEMVRIARLAVLTAGGLSAAAWGDPQVADLQCSAWACLGNASRIVGDVAQAQDALDHAATLFEAGTGDSLLRARLYDFQASLESARGRHDRALIALDVVVD